MSVRTIRVVVFAVDRRRGAILLADRMGMAWVAKRIHVRGADVRREHARGRAPSTQGIIDDRFRGGRQDAFRKRLGLSEQRPRPESEGEPRIGSLPRVSVGTMSRTANRSTRCG